MFQQVVINSEECDEDVDGYGDGDRGDFARRADIHPTHLQLHPHYYFILTALYSHNTNSNA